MVSSAQLLTNPQRSVETGGVERRLENGGSPQPRQQPQADCNRQAAGQDTAARGEFDIPRAACTMQNRLRPRAMTSTLTADSNS
jgi:hypothetical protein